MKLIIKLLVLVAVGLNAQILEISQQFNRKLVKVQKEPVGVSKSFYGHTAINESETYDIITRFDGFVTKIYADKTYMHLKKGTPLFSVYSDEIFAISKELHLAKQLNENIYQSSKEKLITRDVSSKEIAKIEKDKSKRDVTLYAPSNSIVLQKNLNQGSTVKKGKLLYQLSNIENLWFIAKVYQKDLAFIKKGMKARIVFDGISKVYQSKVDYIYPTIDKMNKTVDVRFVLDNKDLMLSLNLFAKVTLKDQQRTALTLPKTAVLNKGKKYYVFQSLSKTEFEPIEVQAKRISSTKYEILDGVEEGQEVINNALFLLDSDAVTNSLYEDDDDDW